MKTVTKTFWRMSIRDKKDWSKWSYSKEYESFEDLMAASCEYLKEHPGLVTCITTRSAWVTVK